MKHVIALIAATMMMAPIAFSHAEETVKEKVQEAGKDTKRAFKKGANRVEEKSCEMINGKLQCLGDKIENRAEETSDKVKDMAD